MAGHVCDFPLHQIVCDVPNGSQESRATKVMHGELRAACRIAARRSPEPTAAIINSRSVRTAETVAPS